MAASLIRSGSGTRLCPLLFKSSFKINSLKLKSPFCSRKDESLLIKMVCRISVFRHYSVSASLRMQSSPISHTNSSFSVKSPQTPPDTTEIDKDHREHYIPVTRHSLIRYLVEAKDIFTEGERRLFPDFVRALDIALVNKYLGVLEEMKVLFDPCNPDKDTQQSREWTRKQRLDNEFCLLQLLEDVMAKANFHELSPKKLEQFLKDHEAREKVRVRVDRSHYDVLRVWVLGHEVPKIQLTFLDKILNRLLLRSPRKPADYYKRVVVALRLKDSKLMLKAFKEVPVQGIEKLLPDGSIHMRSIDKAALVTSAAVAGSGLLAKLVAYLVDVDVDWALVLSLVSGAIGFRVWSTYTNRRNAYLGDVSRLLYFKNIASNKGLLTLLVDRAEDESLKEAVLAYAFLLNSQPHDLRNKVQSLFVTLPPGGLTDEELTSSVEKWLEKKTGAKTKFNSTEAVKTLKHFGILSEKNNKYHVLQLDAAASRLPQCPQSVIARRASDADITEGYDRDEHLETEVRYQTEDHKMQKHGWF